MAVIPTKGRVYRRCDCRGADGKQLGAACPQLTGRATHGSWAYAVDRVSNELNSQGGRKRTTRRRSGFPSRTKAAQALRLFLQGEATGVYADPDENVAQYLEHWLATKQERLKTATLVQYRDYITNDLTPAFGTLRLDDLRTRHIEHWQLAELQAGRGRTCLYRATATLSSALGTAVRAGRLGFNPAAHPSVLTRPVPAERVCWSPEQAAAFLHHQHTHYGDQLADLFEVLIGTGLRRGEALGLHWSDVHLAERTLYVRWTLSAVHNNHLHLGPPKTKASRAWIRLSPRVTAALHRQAAHQQTLQPAGTPMEGLVFATDTGSPLRPQRVLDQLRRRTAEVAGLPRIGVHDLRHTAATIMIMSQVPIAIVSKTLRHSTVATTVNLYGHLLKTAAQDAVTALADALDHADRHRPAPTDYRWPQAA